MPLNHEPTVPYEQVARCLKYIQSWRERLGRPPVVVEGPQIRRQTRQIGDGEPPVRPFGIRFHLIQDTTRVPPAARLVAKETVEQGQLLVAVTGVVRRIDVQNQAFDRTLAMDLDELLDQEAVQLGHLPSRDGVHAAFHGTLREVLGLTKMNWNNDAIYDRLPVTMGFASILARTVKRMPQLLPKPYQIRFLM